MEFVATLKLTDAASTRPILSIRDLVIAMPSSWETVRAVDGLSIDVRPGETLGVVGESGAGKSMTALSILGLLPEPWRITEGEIIFDGVDLVKLNARELRQLRGREIAMVSQDPMNSLDPVCTIGAQLEEAVRTHDHDSSRSAIRHRLLELMSSVGLPHPREQYDQYPFELSGGMRQRVMIAMALANGPRIIIADEPTTALDVTIQAQILDVLRAAHVEIGAALLLITHDFGLIAEMADRVVVMYGGRAAEVSEVRDIFDNPRHPYTIGLLRSMPKLDATGSRLDSISGQPPRPGSMPGGCSFQPRCPLAGDHRQCLDEKPGLEPQGPGHLVACHLANEINETRARDLYGKTTVGASFAVAVDDETSIAPKSVLQLADVSKHFRAGGLASVRRRLVRAVDGVSLDLVAGETVSLVGESGCGKSTLARTVVRLYDPTAGSISFKGKDVTHSSRRELTPVRRDMQIVFQDPFASLDARMTVRSAISEPLKIHRSSGRGDRKWVDQLLERVGLHNDDADKYPHQFSGGQRQRIAIARALALRPSVLILDEPVTALDVSIQAQVINLLQDLQAEFGLTYLFIAHDLSVVRHISTRVAVMYMGRIVELGSTEQIFSRPSHPYTQALLAAVPVAHPSMRKPRGRVPLPSDAVASRPASGGCVFRSRCPKADAICADVVPELSAMDDDLDHRAACHHREPIDVLGHLANQRALTDVDPNTV